MSRIPSVILSVTRLKENVMVNIISQCEKTRGIGKIAGSAHVRIGSFAYPAMACDNICLRGTNRNEDGTDHISWMFDNINCAKDFISELRIAERNAKGKIKILIVETD